MPDGAWTHPESQQLPPRDHTVLPSHQRPNGIGLLLKFCGCHNYYKASNT
jgi:hypothetical protein